MKKAIANISLLMAAVVAGPSAFAQDVKAGDAAAGERKAAKHHDNQDNDANTGVHSTTPQCELCFAPDQRRNSNNVSAESRAKLAWLASSTVMVCCNFETA